MRSFAIFLLVAVGTFIIDQNIKALFLGGYYREGSCIDLALHFNKGWHSRCSPLSALT